MPPTTASARPIDDLDRDIVTLSRRINQATYRLLLLVREFDECRGWVRWGSTSCAEWLAWRCGLSPGAARERVRIAHALLLLPRIAAAFAAGTLSYSKVRALTRVATATSEAELLAFALGTTAARLEERCAQLRNVQPGATAAANRAHAARGLRSWEERDRGVTVITVELPSEQGALVLKALDRGVALGCCESGPEFGPVSFAAQRADALVAVASGYLQGEAEATGEPSPLPRSSADRYQVMVHVDAAALGRGESGGADLALESVRRLLCDGAVVPLAEDAAGEVLQVGRRQRTVPTAMRRALWARDRGCAWPGCTHTRFLDAHHVQHWCAGGETSLANATLLCGAHHRLVHEGGYAVVVDASGQRRFLRPDGRAVPECGYCVDDVVDPTAAGDGMADDDMAGGEAVVEADDAARISAETRGPVVERNGEAAGVRTVAMAAGISAETRGSRQVAPGRHWPRIEEPAARYAVGRRRAPQALSPRA